LMRPGVRERWFRVKLVQKALMALKDRERRSAPLHGAPTTNHPLHFFPGSRSPGEDIPSGNRRNVDCNLLLRRNCFVISAVIVCFFAVGPLLISSLFAAGSAR
jgi:hypothetical protein